MPRLNVAWPERERNPRNYPTNYPELPRLLPRPDLAAIHGISPLMESHGYWHDVVATFSTFLNVLRGGPREPICTTLHDNIEAGGWASRVPWPASWLAHFRFSAGK